MAGKSLEERLIDRMHELEEQYRDTLESRAKNRNSLRDLLDEGMLSAEHAAQVEEIYPKRAPRGSAAEEAVA